MTTDQGRRAEFRLLRDMVEDHIERAVQLAGGSLSEAAKMLGVGRSTIYRKYRITGITRVGKSRPVRERLERLREAAQAAGENQEGEYELGVANGLIQARHIMEGRPGSPSYL